MKNEMLPISKIGPIQLLDVQNSTGIIYYDEYYRLCEIIKNKKAFDNRGDCSPYRMAKLFGGLWQDYNYHFIVQVAGCPLTCSYCYVDNFKLNQLITIEKLIKDFIQFKQRVKIKYQINIKVFHLMGGAPGIYARFWPQIRKMLDDYNQQDIILFSDVIFVEHWKTGEKPWKYLNIERFILTGCLKGVNRKNFHQNTKMDLYDKALEELVMYTHADNFYLCLIKNDKNISNIIQIIDSSKIDYLTVVNYKVNKTKGNKR